MDEYDFSDEKWRLDNVTEDDIADLRGEASVDRLVVVTMYGERFHNIPWEGARAKHSACGGFVRSNLSVIPQSEAVEQGYSECHNCPWV